MHVDLPSDLRPSAARRGAPSNRGFALLWLASVLVPLLSVAGAGAFSWRAVEAEASARIERTVELLRQNVMRTFGAHEAIMVAIAHAVAGRSEAEVRQDPAVHGLLADLAAAAAPAVSGVLVADGVGHVLAASYEHPARPADLSDRDYVARLREEPGERAVGVRTASRPMGSPVIPVARRAASVAPRAEDGWILVSSFDPRALEAFYASIVETGRDVVALYRLDGALLARHPPVTTRLTEAQSTIAIGLLNDLLARPDGAEWITSPIDGVVRLFTARPLGDWPVAVVYGLDRTALAGAWRRRMVAPAAGGFAAAALLIALTAAAHRGARLQREQAEARAEAEAQLASAGRAATIGLLAGGLAHEVKNLVQAVRSGARVMDRRAEDPAEVRRCAGLLQEAAERGGRLVDAMLAFARASVQSEEPPALDVRAALREVAELLSRTLGSGWPLRAELPDRLPAARGDRVGFQSAMVNLAANARDAMPGGGPVTIRAWTEELAEPLDKAGLPAGRYVVAAVRDSGIGMDPATLARLGEPFFTTKPPGIGTGLGLPAVRGFCARAGGALRVDSAPGEGTTAAIWLPVA